MWTSIRTHEGMMIYGFENCELDLGAHELRRAGGAQAVEPRVFKLLGYLVENSHRMVSKDEILAHVGEGPSSSIQL